jgi:hypothetical protein
MKKLQARYATSAADHATSTDKASKLAGQFIAIL